MTTGTTRRGFFHQAALGGAGILLTPGLVRAAQKDAAPSDKLNIAIVGAGGRGRANTNGVKSENIVALCDINDKNLAAATKRFPKATPYVDWRKCLDQKDIEAVVCSTTDHTHAFVSLWAMRRGKHVYCEKPLAHSVYEARVMRQTYLARKDTIATQMGTQIHAGGNYRRVVELVQAGAIGPIREVHVWCGRVGPCPGRLRGEHEVPKHLHWDLWLGPAPYRPYHPGYLPGCMRWEQWWDFGNGCIGDMGSHLIDLPFWALQLTHPTTAEARGEPFSEECYPHWLIASWDHPANDVHPGLKLTWYDGKQRPPSPEGHDLKKWGIGVLFVGEKGKLLADYGKRILLPEAAFKDYQPPKPTLPPSPGHHKEWLLGCKTGSPTLCNFNYSGRLIENNLLGTVAFRCRKKLEWDAEKLEATNCPAAAELIRRDYREGWVLEG